MPDIVISLTAAQLGRITAAFGRRNRMTGVGGTPREATEAEIRQILIDFIGGIVVDDDRREAERKVSSVPLGLS